MAKVQRTRDAQEVKSNSVKPPEQKEQAAGEAQEAPIKENGAPSAQKSTSRPKKTGTKKPLRTDPKEGQTIGDYIEEQDRKAAAGENMTIEEAIGKITTAAEMALEAIAEMQKRQEAYFDSGEWKKIKAALPELTEADGRLIEIMGLTDAILDSLPLMHERITAYRAEHQGELKLSELLAQEDPDGITLYEIITRTRWGAQEFGFDLQTFAEPETGEADDKPKTAWNVRYNKIDNDLQIPTDKFGRMFFSNNAPASKGTIDGKGNILADMDILIDGITLRYERKTKAAGSKPARGGKESVKKATLYYDYAQNTELLEKMGVQTGDITDYDYFVTAVIDNLYRNRNVEVTLTKIWHELGNSGSPASEQLTPVANSIIRGIATPTIIDNTEILKAWGVYNGKSRRIVSTAMPVTIIEDINDANGAVIDGKIRINDFSPFYKVSHAIAQYRTWNSEILHLYKGYKTKRYYSVMRYLLSEIGWMINSTKRKRKITYAELHEAVGDKTPRDERATIKMLYTLLDKVFIPGKYITGYEEDTKHTLGVRLKGVKQEK